MVLDKKPKVKYFEGKSALEEIFKDILKCPNQEILAWFSDYHYNLDDDFMFEYFVPNRIKNKNWVQVITPNTKINLKHKKDGKRQKKELR